MIKIKTLTKQEYEKYSKIPSEVVFYETEKDVCNIISYHLAERMEENIEILKQFHSLKETGVFEVEYEKGILYLVYLKSIILPIKTKTSNKKIL